MRVDRLVVSMFVASVTCAVASAQPVAAEEGASPAPVPAVLVGSDGSRTEVPVRTTIVSETVGGVTRWSRTVSVSVPAEALGDSAEGDPLDALLNTGFDPGEVVDQDEVGAPAPGDLLVPTNDPLAPATGVVVPEEAPSDMDDVGGCETDSAGVVQACLRMYFTAYTSGSAYYVRLVSYHHRWRRFDAQVRMYNAFARASVAGGKTDGKYYNNYAEKSFGTPVSDTLYGHKPSWSGMDIDVSRYSHYQASNNEVTIARGTRTWTLLHSNVFQGKPPF